MTGQARRILIVDDEANIRHALKRSLRKEGYEMLFASEPDEALELLRTQEVDMVISDHLMPNMTGLDLLALVRDRRPDAIRIMLTGHAQMQTAIDAINRGNIRSFLTKPWDDTELKVTLYLAFEQLDVERENRRLLALLRTQLNSLEAENLGMGTKRDW